MPLYREPSGPSRLSIMQRPVQIDIYVEGDTPTTYKNLEAICGNVCVGSSWGPDYRSLRFGFLTKEDIMNKLPKLKKTSRVHKIVMRFNNGPEEILFEKK